MLCFAVSYLGLLPRLHKVEWILASSRRSLGPIQQSSKIHWIISSNSGHFQEPCHCNGTCNGIQASRIQFESLRCEQLETTAQQTLLFFHVSKLRSVTVPELAFRTLESARKVQCGLEGSEFCSSDFERSAGMALTPCSKVHFSKRTFYVEVRVCSMVIFGHEERW